MIDVIRMLSRIESDDPMPGKWVFSFAFRGRTPTNTCSVSIADRMEPRWSGSPLDD